MNNPVLPDMEILLDAGTRSRRYAYHTCSLPLRNADMYQLHISDDQRDRMNNARPHRKVRFNWASLLLGPVGALILALFASGCSNPTAPTEEYVPVVDVSMLMLPSTTTCVARGAEGVQVGTVVISTRDVPGELAPAFDSLSLSMVDNTTSVPTTFFKWARLYVPGSTQLGTLASYPTSTRFTFVNMNYGVAPRMDAHLEIRTDIPTDAPLNKTFAVGFTDKYSERALVAKLGGKSLRVNVKTSTFGPVFKICS